MILIAHALTSDIDYLSWCVFYVLTQFNLLLYSILVNTLYFSWCVFYYVHSYIYQYTLTQFIEYNYCLFMLRKLFGFVTFKSYPNIVMFLLPHMYFFVDNSQNLKPSRIDVDSNPFVGNIALSAAPCSKSPRIQLAVFATSRIRHADSDGRGPHLLLWTGQMCLGILDKFESSFER